MTIKLKVTGMSCEHCVQAVKRALEGVPGVKSAQVSLEQGLVEVETDTGSVPVDQLIKAVEEAGYRAETLS
jgi:copper ion binding protein